jgi:hypothetical protein
MSSFTTDCLVLKIVEHYVDTKDLDTTLYVLYDKITHHFVIRGKRNSEKMPSCTFSFNCEFAHELADFISFIICEKNQWTYVLYNYDNLPATSDEITYDFLTRNDSKVYEIAGYDKQEYNRDYLLKNLRILRNVFNYYN